MPLFPEVALFRLALALSALPAAALAQPAVTCATFAESYGIPAPPDSLTDQAALQAVTKALLPVNFDLGLWEGLPEAEALPLPEIATNGDCTLPEMAMLTANFAAIGSAEAPADPAALAGTWMSDDILLGVAGVMVPGQEMLLIGAPLPVPAQPRPASEILGPRPGSLPVSQYWYRAVAPYGGALWNEDDDYFGLVVTGHLTQTGTGGFDNNPIIPSLDYVDNMLSQERTEDLFLKGRLNIFERGVSFALSDETLVVTYEAPKPIMRQGTARQRTYHRVAPGSPDAALRMVSGMGLPAMPYFGCLTRMISTGDPALAAAMAPLTPEAFDAGQREYDQWNLVRDAYETAMLEGREDAALKEKVLAPAERMADFAIKAQAAAQGVKAAGLCPEPPRIGF